MCIRDSFGVDDGDLPLVGIQGPAESVDDHRARRSGADHQQLLHVREPPCSALRLCRVDCDANHIRARFDPTSVPQLRVEDALCGEMRRADPSYPTGYKGCKWQI